MPASYKIIKDQTTNLFLTSYSTVLANCLWGNPLDSLHFADQTTADATIASWGETPGARFIGQNPPPR